MRPKKHFELHCPAKLNEVGPLSFTLWVCGVAHCNLLRTDGVIPKAQLHALYQGDGSISNRARVVAAERLVQAGLWQDHGTHWQVVFGEVQP